jgi:hypothetical protein
MAAAAMATATATVKGDRSKSCVKYAYQLAADVADLRPNWFSERSLKPPNKAQENGLAVEPDARLWFCQHKNVEIVQVGGILSDCGRFWTSTDGLTVDRDGQLDGCLELKCPMLHTQAEYVTEGVLPVDYRPQVHGELFVTGLKVAHFVSYAKNLPPLYVEVIPDDYTDRLAEAMEDFWGIYDEVLSKL